MKHSMLLCIMLATSGAILQFVTLTALAQDKKELVMNDKQWAEFEATMPQDRRLPEFRERIGFDSAVRKETISGLVFVDIRSSEVLNFIMDWAKSIEGNPNPNQWETQISGNGVSFEYHFQGKNTLAFISLQFYNNYYTPKSYLLFKTTNTTMGRIPWYKCSKEIGTICIQQGGGILFAYKNVFVEVASPSTLSDGSPLNEALALWVFEQLLPTVLPPLLKKKEK